MRLADTSVRMYRKGDGTVSFRMHSYLMVPARTGGFSLTAHLTDFVGALTLASGLHVPLDNISVTEGCFRALGTMVHEFWAWGDAELGDMTETVGTLRLEYKLFGALAVIDLVVPVIPRGPKRSRRAASSNRSFDADTHRQGAASRAREHTSRGALPVRAGQLRRYAFVR
jgi:hypothetical protein